MRGVDRDPADQRIVGHEKGAFTGADELRIGRFEAAAGGTILLDEISEISPELQAKLLRVLEEREIERVGGNKPIAVDVRIIATTNRDLLAEAQRGRFREDLYYRLNVIPVALPPLRDRLPDIPDIIRHYLAIFGRDVGVKPKLTDSGERLLLTYRWPGNVRELVNIVERLVVLGGDAPIDADAVRRCLPELARQTAAASSSASESALPIEATTTLTLEAVERAHIQAVLTRCGSGNKQAAADMLGISRRSLHDRLTRWGLDPGT